MVSPGRDQIVYDAKGMEPYERAMLTQKVRQTGADFAWVDADTLHVCIEYGNVVDRALDKHPEFAARKAHFSTNGTLLPRKWKVSEVPPRRRPLPRVTVTLPTAPVFVPSDQLTPKVRQSSNMTLRRRWETLGDAWRLLAVVCVVFVSLVSFAWVGAAVLDSRSTWEVGDCAKASGSSVRHVGCKSDQAAFEVLKTVSTPSACATKASYTGMFVIKDDRVYCFGRHGSD